MSLRVIALREPAELEALAAEWERLAASLELRTPFTLPLWNLLWWKHFHEARRLIRDELCAYALRDDYGRLVAVAPMMCTERPGFGPFRTRQLQFFGADPNITELRGLVCAEADEPRAYAALCRHLCSVEPRAWHWLQWPGLRSDPAAAGAIPDDLKVSVAGVVSDYCLPLPADWAQFRSQLPRNIKESLRKCYNSLQRDGHVFEFRRITRPEDSDAAIARFLALHSARAAAALPVRHRNVFASERSRAFLAEFAGGMAARGQLQVFEIAIGGEIIASRLGFTLGRTLYLYYSGYDPAWSRYSIMTTVLAEALRWAIAEGYACANLSTGSDVSKTRWHPAELRFDTLLLRRHAWAARLAHSSYAALSEGLGARQRGGGLAALLAGALRRSPVRNV